MSVSSNSTLLSLRPDCELLRCNHNHKHHQIAPKGNVCAYMYTSVKLQRRAAMSVIQLLRFGVHHLRIGFRLVGGDGRAAARAAQIVAQEVQRARLVFEVEYHVHEHEYDGEHEQHDAEY